MPTLRDRARGSGAAPEERLVDTEPECVKPMANKSATSQPETKSRHGVALGSSSNNVERTDTRDSAADSARTLKSTSTSLHSNESANVIPVSVQLNATHQQSSSSSTDPSLSSSTQPNLELRQRKRGTDSRTTASSEPDAALPHPRQRKMEAPEPKTRPAWLLLALASGGFAALNGAFAKLYVRVSLIAHPGASVTFSAQLHNHGFCLSPPIQSLSRPIQFPSLRVTPFTTRRNPHNRPLTSLTERPPP